MVFLSFDVGVGFGVGVDVVVDVGDCVGIGVGAGVCIGVGVVLAAVVVGVVAIGVVSRDLAWIFSAVLFKLINRPSGNLSLLNALMMYASSSRRYSFEHMRRVLR